MQTITTSRSGCHTEKNIRNWGGVDRIFGVCSVDGRPIMTPIKIIESL